MCYDHNNENNRQNQETEGLTLKQLRVFERVIAVVTHHQVGQHIDQQDNGGLLDRTRTAEMIEKQNAGGNHTGSRRDRQAHKTPRLNRVGLHIETGQAQSATDNIEKGRKPTELTKRLQSPGVHEQTGGNTKGDQIHQGIVFNPETTGGSG